MRKILVTGGAGYIGSHTVVELFGSGYKPIILDNFSNSKLCVIDSINSIINDEIKVYQGDCNDHTFVKSIFDNESEISGVIHFAAYKSVIESVKVPMKYYYNNINSLMVLLEIMLDYKVKDLVFSSSCTVYGQPDKLPVTEDSPLKNAESPYGKTKQICEDIIKDSIFSGMNLKSIALRYFNPIGAHPSGKIGELSLGIPDNLLPYITQTAAGIRNELTVYGNDYNTKDGSCIRDFIHVVDLSKAHVKALHYLSEQKSNRLWDVINIGTGKGNSVLEIIKKFETITGQKLKYKIGSRRLGDIEMIYADVKKAKRVINWASELSIDQAINDSWNWQKSMAKNIA